MTSRELRLWFDVIKTLPAAHSCTAALAVYGPDDDADEDGAYYPADDLIVVYARFGMAHTITTLLHEISHAVTPRRYRRPHGFVWRRIYASLIEQFTGIRGAEASAENWRSEHRGKFKIPPARWEALDVVAMHAIGRMLGARAVA